MLSSSAETALGLSVLAGVHDSRPAAKDFRRELYRVLELAGFFVDGGYTQVVCFAEYARAHLAGESNDRKIAQLGSVANQF